MSQTNQVFDRLIIGKLNKYFTSMIKRTLIKKLKNHKKDH